MTDGDACIGVLSLDRPHSPLPNNIVDAPDLIALRAFNDCLQADFRHILAVRLNGCSMRLQPLAFAGALG